MKIRKFAMGVVVLILTALAPLSSLSSSKGKDNTIILSKDNVLSLNGVIDDESVGELQMKLRAMDSKLSSQMSFSKKPIYIFLNTPGGSIQAGLEMFEAANGLGRPIHTITLFAASMGFQTVQNLGERLILKSGVLMSHRAQGAFGGYFGGQRPSQTDSRYGLWLQRIDELDQQTVKRSNGKQTLDSYRKQYADEMWLTGEQAVEQGYADKVVSVKCDKSLAGVDTHTIDFLGLSIQYDTDRCPLNTALMNIKMGQSKDPIFTAEKVEEIKNKFLDQFENKKNHVVDMY